MTGAAYVFCLTPANPPPILEGTGIDGTHPLTLEVVGDIAAVVAEVAPEEFSGPGSRERMESLAWIGLRALRHEEVIVAVMRGGPVLPVRFGTVFSSRAALEPVLRQHGQAISHFFADVAGASECVLKGFVDRPQANGATLAALLAAEQGQLDGLGPGKRYVAEQKVKASVGATVSAWLRATAVEVLEEVREVFRGCREIRLLGSDVMGDGREMFLHAALLVPDAAVARLGRMTDEWNERLGPRGLSFAASGPWPPYHFAPVLEMTR